MNLRLLETDEAINKGVAKNISIEIDGVRLIIPIRTKISELLVLVKEKGLPNIGLRTPDIVEPRASNAQIQPINEGVIEKEDVVRCVRVLERAVGADVDICMGGEYRVLGMKKIVSGGQTVVEHYEVVDDNSPVPRRVMVSPVEVVLLRKHVPGPKKVLVYEEIFPCECGEPTACTLDLVKNKYIGQCKCGKILERDRPQRVEAK